MVEVGEEAPDFELAGVADGVKNNYCLSEATGAGRYLLLMFYPADFSPVCTAEMCAIRDSEFFKFTENVNVWGISGDSVYAHQAFDEEFELNFPLLADTDHSVAKRYSTRYEEWEGQRGITKRAVFVIDPERRVRYTWVSDDAYVEPDLWPVKEALDAAIEEGLDTDEGTPALAEPYQGTQDEPSE